MFTKCKIFRAKFDFWGTYGRRSTWFRFTGVPKKDMADTARLNPYLCTQARRAPMPHVPYLGSVVAA